MTDSKVPGSMEELIERYDRLITWTIHRTIRGAVDEDTVQDLRQQVYLRIMQADYLGRCRVYYATRAGRFSTSLSTLVSNLVRSRHTAAKADPLARAWELVPDLNDFPRATGPRDAEGQHRGMAAVHSHERAIEARDVLAAIGRRLYSKRASISTPDLIETALTHGLHSKTLAAALAANPSTVRFHLHKVRAEARRLEGPCRAATTRSVSRSLASKSHSGAPSAPLTVPA